MTWQRIDEYTYIDDTLITYVEYQLFIDEMREKGKYYQPDHWTSYQFPEGQAREPILGVRHSDAAAFCEWLANRESKELKFRLPKQKEAEAFPVKSIGISPLGCWIDGNDNFVWIGAVPQNPRNLDFEALNRVRDYTLTYALDRALDFDLNRVLDLALKPNRRADTIDHARALASALFSTRTSDRALDHDHDKALALAIARARDLVLVLDFDIASARDLNLTLDRDLGVYFYVDLYTLQERIAGRSPAFEGIRLVKERIK